MIPLSCFVSFSLHSPMADGVCIYVCYEAIFAFRGVNLLLIGDV